MNRITRQLSLRLGTKCCVLAESQNETPPWVLGVSLDSAGFWICALRSCMRHWVRLMTVLREPLANRVTLPARPQLKPNSANQQVVHQPRF